jgi:hypothetical protein
MIKERIAEANSVPKMERARAIIKQPNLKRGEERLLFPAFQLSNLVFQSSKKKRKKLSCLTTTKWLRSII